MKEAVIVGAGVAGLTAGIDLLRAGFSVTILERLSHPGGNLTAWKRAGCTVDNCLHWLTGTRPGSALHKIWQDTGMLGENVTLIRQERLYTSVSKGQSLSLWRNPRKTEQEMLTLSPDDLGEIKELISVVCRIAEEKRGARAVAVLRYGRLSLAELGARFRHPLIRSFLGDYIGGEFSSLGLILLWAAFARGDADLPAGGSFAAAERMAERFRTLGGKLLLSRRVHRVLFDGKCAVSALTANGEAIDGDFFLFACDPHTVFRDLLPADATPSAFLRRDRNENGKTPTLSALHAAFVAEREDCPVSGSMIFDGGNPRFGKRCNGRMTLRVFDHEAEFAPPGKVVLQVLLFLDGEEADRWISLSCDREHYLAEKAEFARVCSAALLHSWPTLSRSLSLLDVWTPATYVRYTDAYRGDFLGYVLTGGSFPLPIPTRVRGFENVFLASGWQSMPSGLPSAARAGRRAAKAILTASLHPVRSLRKLVFRGRRMKIGNNT